jgi:hypothetical protein
MSKPIDEIKKTIRENRPTISNASVLTYSSLLKSVYLSNNDSVDGMTVDWFKNPENIMDALKDKPAHTRKTAISAVIVLLGKSNDVSPDLVKMMNADSDTVREAYREQQMSDKQKANWISMDTVRETEAKLLDMVKPILSQKHSLSPEQHKMLTNWLLIALSSGVYFPPRRSEFQYIKLKDVSPETDNYIDVKKGVFVLNNYKTAKLYGRDEIPYGKPFGALLKKALVKLEGQTHLLENNRKQFSSPMITSRLNQIFGKKVSTSMLRHIWATAQYEGMPSLKELSENASAMAHSLPQHLEYILRK